MVGFGPPLAPFAFSSVRALPAARHRPPAGPIGYRGVMAVRRNGGRRGKRVLGAAAAVAAVLTVAGCGVFGSSAPETVTRIVTVTPSTDSGGETSSGGGPVTVVAPSAAGPGSTTAPTTDEAATTEDDAAAETTTPAGEPSTTVTTPTTATSQDPAARAVVRKLATRCTDLLTRNEIARVFGTTAISADNLRINEEGNPDNRMTARSKCYYGTSDLSVARPLVVALAGFETPDAAARQVEVTTDSEKAAGAKASQTKVGGQTVQLLLRDGGLAMTQSGALTISIAVAGGIAPDAKLTAALPSLMSAVLNHLG